MARESFAIGTVRVRAGTIRNLELPITRLVTGADVSLPVRVVHGREDGPTMWISAAIHGDEVVGVEVVRQVLAGLPGRGTATAGEVALRAQTTQDDAVARLYELRALGYVERHGDGWKLTRQAMISVRGGRSPC